MPCWPPWQRFRRRQPSIHACRRRAADDRGEQRGTLRCATALLRKRNFPSTVERFTIEKTLGREPRTEGRNIVATFGSGANPIVVGAHYDASAWRTGR